MEKKRERIHLTNDEAGQLAVILRRCAETRRKNGECRYISEMTKEEQAALIIGARCDNDIIRDAAVKIAYDGLHRFIGGYLTQAAGLDPDVILSDCMLAVWKGLCDYSPDEGAQLHSYLFTKVNLTVKNSLKEIYAERDDLSVSEIRDLATYDKAVREMQSRSGIYEPTPQEVADYLDRRGGVRARLSCGRIEYILSLRRRRVDSLDSLEADQSVLSTGGDPTGNKAVCHALNDELKDLLNEAEEELEDEARALAAYLYERFRTDPSLNGNSGALHRCIVDFKALHPEIDTLKLRELMKDIRAVFRPLAERAAIFAA